MNNKIWIPVSFIFGAACGFLGAHFFLKEKYHREAQEKIDEALEVVRNLRAKKPPEEILAEKEKERAAAAPAEDPREAKQTVPYDGVYHTPVPVHTPRTEIELNPKNEEKVYIREEDLGDEDDFEIIHWTYFVDGVIADEDDFELSLDDINNALPDGALSRLRIEEVEGLYVRNYKTKCDYSVLVDERTYTEVVGEKPYLNRGR